MHSRRITSILTLSALVTLAAACGLSGSDLASGPVDQGPPGGPVGPPTTGGKWEGHESTDACGRTTIAYRIVDEVCAGTDAPDYLEHFRAPIMRDGARIGDRLYAADATHLWVLDVQTPAAPIRTALLTGFGQPLATATHAGRLLLAAADEGLIIADVAEPDAPRRQQTIAMPGPALDVFVDGDVAYVATGHGGLVVVELGETARIVGEIPLPGFTAAVAVRGDVAYVAACDALLTLDTATGEVLGETWVDDAYDDDGVLVAPAKDVFVSDAGVFVAAGRYGAVRVDAADPELPSIVGNCTLRTEVGFYASGVRAEGERLFIAGGEWGILPIDLGDDTSCTALVRPDPIPAPPGGGSPDEDGECSSEPPWEVLPWEDSWLPPVQAGQDPLQTLPDGDVLYAFGDATRIGIRAVDVRLPASEDLEKVGRYEEPRLMSAIAARGDRVLLVGPRGGVFRRDGATLALEDDSPDFARAAVDGVFLDDGRWVLAMPEPHRLTVEGGQVITLDSVIALWPNTMAARGETVAVSDGFGVAVADFTDGSLEHRGSDRIAELPAAVAATEDGIVVAAPEWTDAVAIPDAGAPTPLGGHGVFGQQDVASVDAWRVALPRRLLARSRDGILELATLGRHAGLAHHAGVDAVVALPPGEYVGLSSAGDRAYAVSIDRGTYRSQLVTIDVSSDPPSIVGVEAWTGMAAGVAATSSGVFVADRDVGVRIYDPVGDGVSLAGVVDLSGGAR